MPVIPEFRNLADQFARLSRLVGTSMPVDEALTVVTGIAVQAIDGAEAAAVTRGRKGKFHTVAATGELARQVDAIQYELMSGPSVDPIVEHTVFQVNDLRTDPRWPEFGQRAVRETGVISVLTFRMFFEDDDLVAGLNLYGTRADAFDELARTAGLVLATHGALALTGAMQLERIENLERALASNRDIGIAMGIVMKGHLTTKDQAFDLLRVASQHTHRKINQVAADVIETGELLLQENVPSALL